MNSHTEVDPKAVSFLLKHTHPPAQVLVDRTILKPSKEPQIRDFF